MKKITVEQVNIIISILAELPAKNVYGILKMLETLPDCKENE